MADYRIIVYHVCVHLSTSGGGAVLARMCADPMLLVLQARMLVIAAIFAVKLVEMRGQW